MTPQALLYLDALRSQLERLEDMVTVKTADQLISPRIVAQKMQAARATVDALERELRPARELSEAPA